MTSPPKYKGNEFALTRDDYGPIWVLTIVVGSCRISARLRCTDAGWSWWLMVNGQTLVLSRYAGARRKAIAELAKAIDDLAVASAAFARGDIR